MLPRYVSLARIGNTYNKDIDIFLPRIINTYLLCEDYDIKEDEYYYKKKIFGRK